MAFAVTDYFTGESLDDPTFVEWEAYVQYDLHGTLINKTLHSIKKCNNSDYETFFALE